MQPAHSISSTGYFTILKTDNGQHSARQWARATIGLVFQIDDSAPKERREQLLKIKHEMVEALEPFFRSPSPLRAIEAYEAVLQTTKDTPWYDIFIYEPVRQQIISCLERNMRS